MRARRVLPVVAVIVGLLACVGVYQLGRQVGPFFPERIGRACTVRTPTGVVALDSAQMANAATIAAVGLRQHVPDRAIVVAIAVAFQESKLQNLDRGDRDSVGLFQQRPSQGWGSPSQLQDPRYAASKFYTALLRVTGWESLRITEAAQRVQRSAYPEAYQKWAEQSTVLADALAGRATSAVSCIRVGEPPQRGAVAAETLADSLRLDWGSVEAKTDADGTELPVSASSDQQGWQYAHWLVAHSAGLGVQRVRYGDHVWSAADGRWRQVASTEPSAHVVAEVYP